MLKQHSILFYEVITIGEWIDNIALLNSGKFSAQSLASKIREFIKDTKMPNPETVILFSPDAKWLYLYSNCLFSGPSTFEEFVADPVCHFQTNAERLSLFLDTAVVYNSVVDGSELVMVLSCKNDCGTRVNDTYAWSGMGSALSAREWSYIPGMQDRRMDVCKWSRALGLDGDVLKQVLGEENLLPTDRYVKIGRCLGYDDVLHFFDLHSIENISMHHPEKLAEFSAIRVSKGR